MTALRRSPGAALAVLVLSACGRADFSTSTQPADWAALADGARWRSLAVLADGGPGFTAVPPSWSGVSFANRLNEESMLENQMLTNGSGVALADVDGDGRVDLFFARLDGANALYRNLGDWRFEDVTAASGLAAEDRFSTGGVFADVDGDGDPDLILTAVGAGTSLYRNDGGGRFTVDPEAGLEPESGAMSAALADIDADGDLDLYVTNYKRRSVMDLYPPQERDFASTVRRTPDGYEVLEPFEAHYELAWRGNELRRLEKAEPDVLYRNDGTGRFTAASPEEGVFRASDGAPFTRALTEWGLAARFGDVDGDGDPDLYVANDLHSPDRLWLNDGAGRFREIDPLALRTTSASSMAVDFSDVDRDGDVDIFTLDMLSRSSRLRKTQDPVARVERAMPGDLASTQQVPRNALHMSRGDGTFAEVGRWAGVEASDWSWSALFLDVDLDGYEDLLIPNGHVRDLMDADTQTRLRQTRLEDWRDALLLYDPLLLENVAFRNRGDGRFEEVGAVWGFAAGEDISHGAALGDLDGDGDLDVVVSRLGDPALLLRNDASGHRIAVRPVGRAPNTAGVGARISVRAPGLPVQTKEIAAGGGYLSGSEPLATFAAPPAGPIAVDVRWRAGGVSRHVVDGPDRLLEIEELERGAPSAEAEDAGPPDEDGADRPPGTEAESGAPWFTLDPDFAPLHDEPLFDETARQPLLPYRLGQLGPRAGWGDLDADGDPDLVLTAGAGAPPALFRNDGGRLVRVALPGPVVPVDQTAALPLPPDPEGGRILLGLSSYEAPESEAVAVPGALSLAWPAEGLGGRSVRAVATPLVPGSRSAMGALAMADVDGDGRLDLFLAGRVLPGRYPESADSRLFLAGGGGGYEPAAASADALRGLGLVTGAVFTDVDRDGDPELVLATEWGPVRLLRNDAGRLVDETDAWGLAGLTGRWNAVAAGDFDGDGRPDLVATSWGENAGSCASPARPLEVYYGDVDRNGTIEVIQARHDPRIGAPAPLASYGRLTRAVPGLADRLPTRRAYADASVEEVLGGTPAGRLEAVTTAHTVFLNRGDHFESRPLPPEAQWAPSFGVAVADADGDGAEDVFLAQNFFATDEDSPRHDAGRGGWLRGDGKGGFSWVPARVSGVAAYGDQRGVAVADVDGDARADLVLGQNGGEARLFRNRGARPGLRVRLIGPPANRFAIGASVRLVYGDAVGPVREIRAGSGAGSHDEPVPVLGIAEPDALTAVEVRWPGGRVERMAVTAAQREVTLRAGAPGEGSR